LAASSSATPTCAASASRTTSSSPRRVTRCSLPPSPRAPTRSRTSWLAERVAAAAKAHLVAPVPLEVECGHRPAAVANRAPPATFEPAALRVALIGAHHPLVGVAVEVVHAVVGDAARLASRGQALIEPLVL